MYRIAKIYLSAIAALWCSPFLPGQVNIGVRPKKIVNQFTLRDPSVPATVRAGSQREYRDADGSRWRAAERGLVRQRGAETEYFAGRRYLPDDTVEHIEPLAAGLPGVCGLVGA